jgi:hypothetical protein
MSDMKPVQRRQRYWENRDFWKDAGERVVTAFLEGVIGVITIDVLAAGSLDFGFWRAVGAGGVMAVLSTVKAMIGSQRKDTTTPVSII